MSLSVTKNSTDSKGCASAPLVLPPDAELEKKFAPKHKRSVFVASLVRCLPDPEFGSFDGLNRRAERLESCGTELGFLEGFDRITSDLVESRLVHANFCRDRFCPMCTWRRSLKIYGNISEIMNHVDRDQYDFLMLTLTIRNIYGNDLPDAIDRLQSAFDTLLHRRELKRVICGFYRTLEVTRNTKKTSPWYGSFHPHFHVILAVRKSYWSHHYISHEKWLQYWRDAYGDQTITQVDIHKIKPRKSSDSTAIQTDEMSVDDAVREVSKYMLKDKQMFSPKAFDESLDNLISLQRSLKNRRLVAFGGIFRQIAQALSLEDAEGKDADLISVGEYDSLNPDLEYVLKRYHWGVGCYVMDEKYLIAE